MSEIIETSIGELAVVFDGPHATPEKTDKGPYFLSISSLENGKLDLSKSARISDEDFKKWTKRVTPQEGDILFSYETRLGEAALMPKGIKACLGRRMGLLRPDPKKVDSKYLLYAYIGPKFQNEIKARTNIGATVDRIALKELPSFPIEIPPLPEQKAIAHILGTLDEKIELNRQMNQTLEAMAQALFKSWFVDFDPVIDNALAQGNPIPEELQARAEKRRHVIAGTVIEREERPKQSPNVIASDEGARQSYTSLKPLLHTNPTLAAKFPAAFVFNETLGKWIPEGWEVNSLGNLTNELRRGISPKYVEGDGIRVLNQKCIRNHEIDYSLAREHDSNIKPVEGRHLESRDMVVNSTGTGTLGRVANVLSLDRPTVVDSHVTVIRANENKILKNYFNAYIFSIENVIEAMGEGSTGQTELSRQRLSELNILVPTIEVQTLVELHLSKIYDKKDFNSQETITLTQLRDRLLPELISGRVRVREILDNKN